MTGVLIPVGSPLRVLSSDIGSVIPVVDIADMIGYNRSSITKAIKANEGAFEGLKTFQTLPTPGGDQRFLCLNHTGTERLFLLISPSSKTKRDLFIKVEEFRLKAFGKMEAPKETEKIIQKDIDTLVQQHLHIADAMAQFAHVDRGIAVSVALARVEYDTGADLTCYKNLIRKDRQQAPGYLTPTQIGQELGGLSARTINQMLQQLGYQNYLGDRWQPTKVGENYGENMPFAVSLKNGGVHSDYQLKWSRNIVDTLRSQINGTRQIMDALK